MTDDVRSEFEVGTDETVVAAVGPSFGIERWNDRLAAVVGSETPDGVDPLSLFVRADRDSVSDAVGRCLGSGRAEVSAVLAGDDRWHDVTLQRKCDGAGVPIEIVLIARPRPEGAAAIPFLDSGPAVEADRQEPMVTR